MNIKIEGFIAAPLAGYRPDRSVNLELSPPKSGTFNFLNKV
jgi:hypothetical protein